MGRAQGAATLGESGYERRALDSYFTEPWVTQQLVRHCNIRSPVWEPAAGRGDMVEVLASSGRAVIASDLVDQGGAIEAGFNFLSPPPKWIDRVASIVMNSPYSHADKFIRHALDLMRPQDGQVAMLVRLEFLSAASRRWMSREALLAVVLQLTRRPRWDWWMPEDRRVTVGGKPVSPRHNYVWLVWDYRFSGETMFRVAP